MVTSMLFSLWFLFGAVSLVSFLLIPVLGLSRYKLGEHTPAQIVTGFFIGLVVGGAVFNGLGLAA
jgi:membrane-associated phospholipid phosphatase